MERLSPEFYPGDQPQFEALDRYAPSSVRKLSYPEASALTGNLALRPYTQEYSTAVEDTEQARRSVVGAKVGDMAVNATAAVGNTTADWAVDFVGAFLGDPNLRAPRSSLPYAAAREQQAIDNSPSRYGLAA